MMENHKEFLKYFVQFKEALNLEKGQTNLKYLLCRLDFNEYYQVKALKDEEKKKKAGGNSFDGMNDYGDDDDEDEDEDEDEDDDGEEDDDQDDDQYDDEEDQQNVMAGGGGQQHQQFSMNSGYINNQSMNSYGAMSMQQPHAKKP